VPAVLTSASTHALHSSVRRENIRPEDMERVPARCPLYSGVERALSTSPNSFCNAKRKKRDRGSLQRDANSLSRDSELLSRQGSALGLEGGPPPSRTAPLGMNKTPTLLVSGDHGKCRPERTTLLAVKPGGAPTMV